MNIEGSAEDGPPSVAALRAAVAAFRGPAATPLVATPSGVIRFNGALFDGAAPGHCRALLNWLNSWGCRIRYPRNGEPDLFAAGMHQWWARHGDALPPATSSLPDLTDQDIVQVGDCFAELAGIAVGDPARPRTLGATAASKVLYALRPHAFMPWDEAIARRLHGGRDAAAYAAHQRLGRAWARDLLRQTGLGEAQLAATLGAAGRPLAKILDDYCYLRFTRMEPL